MSFDQFHLITIEQFKTIIIKNIDTVIIFIGITSKLFIQFMHILI